MVMGYANKSFVKRMDWLYIKYGHIIPGDLMRDQENIQTTYNVKDSIEILFFHIEMGQEFAVAGTHHFLIDGWQTWVLQELWKRRNVHMCIVCGRVSRKIITHGCG